MGCCHLCACTDGRTAFLHPSNLSVQYTAASLALITLPLEMKLKVKHCLCLVCFTAFVAETVPFLAAFKDITEAAGGFMTCNGAPLTRTEIKRGCGSNM